MEDTIRYAVNTRITGKVDFEHAPSMRKVFTTGFRNVQTSVEELAAHIDSGHAICCQLKNGANGLPYRDRDHFKLTDFVALDIDHGISLNDVLADPYIQRHATLVYTTASHTSEHNRFRILMQLPGTLYAYDEYEQIVTPLIRRYGADAACKDPHRGWFGSKDCQPVVIGQSLTPEAVAALKSEYMASVKSAAQEKPAAAGASKRVSQKRMDTQFLEPQFNLTDSGNSLRLVYLYENILRYTLEPAKAWYIWNGTLWQRDCTDRIYEYAEGTLRHIYDEAASATDSTLHRELVKWARSSETAKRKKDMLFLASKSQRLAMTGHMFDENPWLFNTFNCTLNLENGEPEVLEHDHTHYLTKIAPVEYRSGATCPKWLEFLDDIFAGEESLIDYVKRAAGYSLTGDVSEQCFFFAYGTGRNGKSVFFKTLERLFGGYAGKAPTEMLMTQRQATIPSDIATLKGKRLVIASEVEENRRMAEGKVKDLTGGDTILARKMYGDWFEFQPTHKLWIFGNHKPYVHGTDKGLWRRIKLIPFSVTIPEDRVIPMRSMIEQFSHEMPGILNWALEGFMEYMEKGLQEPEAVSCALKEYRIEMDTLGLFISEQCMEGQGYSITAKKLFRCYREWCERNGEHCLGYRKFNSRLRERGYAVRPGTSNVTIVFGLDMTG